MAHLEWDSRDFENGLSRCVVYSDSGSVSIWSGLTELTHETPTEQGYIYVDGRRVSTRINTYSGIGSIRAYSYPSEFENDLLGQERPRPFHISYQTYDASGPVVHIMYNVLAIPTGISRNQIGQVVDFSWDLVSKKDRQSGQTKTSYIFIKLVELPIEARARLEDILYGSDSEDPRLPSPKDLVELIEEVYMLRIYDHGDGRWTAVGPDSAIKMLDPETFEITWPSAVYISSDEYSISDL